MDEAEPLARRPRTSTTATPGQRRPEFHESDESQHQPALEIICQPLMRRSACCATAPYVDDVSVFGPSAAHPGEGSARRTADDRLLRVVLHRRTAAMGDDVLRKRLVAKNIECLAIRIRLSELEEFSSASRPDGRARRAGVGALRVGSGCSRWRLSETRPEQTAAGRRVYSGVA